jgi:Mn-dependent DtxR family transcriptional regulator
MASARNFTEKQGQYLAYIRLYQRLHRQAPSEADLQTYFCVSPPSVHRMVVELERKGLISRTPRAARSIRILLPEAEIPELQSIRTSGMAN